ncbi:MAG: hypothetical protein A3C53_01040 [Omnitrophica WOR_2 bacterium RIFCSPHIGHO2_02_FULL_68_15]|nr:MAG: hypothetical protein A3C53_01040 [Omnitrophica WOR_2 bacterium RIFCSPHIGHO2_02_FULL_68_15]
MPPVTYQTIRQAARRIGQAVQPEKIILFGSHAGGQPHPDSDVDLLVIMQSHKRPAERAAELSKFLEPRPFPVDLLVRTPQEIRRRLAMGDSFIRDILRHGRLLYARAA